jgi:uncharacterized membrane protein YhaH (DUF805 family)
MSPTELAACVKTSWSPRIGDPSSIGWFTVGAYFAAAVLAFLVFKGQNGRQRVFWFMLCVVLIALSINKQLDLQTAVAAAGRCLALAQGWYDDRQTVQLVFIVCVAAAGIVFSGFFIVTMRHDLTQNWLALIGLVFLCTFIVVRAVSFHHFDLFLSSEITHVKMNWVMELSGIAMIAINALLVLRSRSETKSGLMK